MENQTVTIVLPKPIYQQAVERAEHAHLSMEEELVTTVADAYSKDSIPVDTRNALEQLDFLDDDELWRAAQLAVAPEIHAQMETLIEKRQLHGLTEEEKIVSEQLVQHADYVMLVRAKAAALLHRRGHDVTTLMQSSPS